MVWYLKAFDVSGPAIQPTSRMSSEDASEFDQCGMRRRGRLDSCNTALRPHGAAFV
jgi:hypothetical protein